MSYVRRPNPKSNWKRPKPKIYDCNTRDLEKFYQNNYSEYLTAKNEIRSREMEREQRGDAEQLTRRFEQRRASSLVYGEDDSPRHHRFMTSRQISNEGTSTSTNEHSFLRTRLENNLDNSTRDARSSSSCSRNVSYTNVLNAPDANSEMASIETRLERLRKLREELGLPAEVNTNANSSSVSSTSTITSASTSETSRRRVQSSPETTRETSRWMRQQSNSRSRASPARSALDSTSYTSKTERTSSLRNDPDDHNASYTSRSSRKVGFDTNGYGSTCESSSSTGRTRKRVEKPSLDDIDMTFDDDTLLTDMRKKLPTSSEILERIRNMDIE